MVSERIQRRIDALLDEADAAVTRLAWDVVRERALAVLTADPDNEDGKQYLAMAERGLATSSAASASGPTSAVTPASPAPALPTAFVSGRYRILRLLGQGGRKRVFLAHDARLDRDVAFATVDARDLQLADRERILREARAMARLGQSPHLVAVFDFGEDEGNPYLVQEFMPGGDVAALLHGLPATAGEGPGLATVQVLAIALDICRALDAIHGAGIIHRDLKPANVFLSADGSAKLGDFGLATDPDLTGLTQHGTLLGTVAYMPPEQAVGGETSPRSDLYSFGCLLYELVTGRPPFTGDDPTSVISQHLNTPPVAPSWLSERCPPALEAIILSLLEKDPSKRPASARVVLAALSRVDPQEKSAPRSEGHVLDRLARGVFVGREKELERLRRAFDDAFAGHGGLVMLVGEPGIGKTRIAQEVETHARMRGAQVLWGANHEDAGAPPYWPWLQAGRQWVGGDAARLAVVATPCEGQLVRLFPELRALPGFVAPEPDPDPEAARFLLFDAFAEVIRAISEDRPLVITLDDLHWADRPTLQLLQHLARWLSRLRVLVLCSYRDTDLVRTHPLSEALASLGRDPGFERVVLRGLSAAETRSYILAAAGVEPRPEMVERIYEETEGNPFFLSEVVNLLAQEGAFDSRTSVSGLRIPDGVREALGRRLDRLPRETNEVLQVAAVVGREFTFDVLLDVTGRETDALVDQLEGAVAARVVEEMAAPGSFRFTHALMQDTLLGELTGLRRTRLHGRVAEALERRLGSRAVEQAALLARHYFDSAVLSPEHARQAVRYAKAAAARAESQTAWGDAAKYYENVLALVAASPDGLAEDEDEAALQAALGRCLGDDGRRREGFEALERAIALYRARGDAVNVAHATLAAIALVENYRSTAAIARRAAEELGDEQPRLRALLLIAAATSFYDMDDSAVEKALQAGVALADPGVEGRLMELRANALWATPGADIRDVVALQQQAVRLHTEAGDARSACRARKSLADILQVAGDVDAAIREARRAEEEARRLHLRNVENSSLNLLAWTALNRCDGQGFAEAADRFSLDYPLHVALRTEQAFRAQRWPDAERHARRYLEVGLGTLNTIHGQADLARVLFHMERHAEAREAMSLALEPPGQAMTALLRPDALAWLDEAFTGLADSAAMAEALETLAARPSWRLAFRVGSSLDRLRGGLALRLGLVDQAEEWYQLGLDLARRERLPVEQGRCLQGLAEVAECSGDSAGAIALLDEAASLFRKHDVPLYLDRTVARKVEFQGLAGRDPTTSIDAVSVAVAAERPDLRAQAAPDGTVTLLFSDIENSTPLNERLGDARWIEVLRAHNAVIEERVRAHHGYVVKTMGDGYMVAFKSAADGLRCAMAIQVAFAGRDDGMRVRIGLHTGEMVREGADFFGRHVNLASRVAGQAGGGEIFVSGVVRELVSGQSFTFDDLGERPLKGFEQPVHVWSARWA